MMRMPTVPGVCFQSAMTSPTAGSVEARFSRVAVAPRLLRHARAAVKHDLPVNMLCWRNVDTGTALIDPHPDTRFIIDHLAVLQPRTPPAPPQPWAHLPKVLDLAKRKNAVIKVSGACTLSWEPYPFPDIWHPRARVFDAWGFDRCLSATTHKRPRYISTSNT
jgi:L-fuconolactonase